VPEDGRDLRAGELGGQPVRLRHALGRDQRPVGDLLPEQVGGGERLPVGEPAFREGAQDLVPGVEDVAVRVAERASLDPGLSVRYESPFFRMPRKPRNRRQ
jgi:hypothetical protein